MPPTAIAASASWQTWVSTASGRPSASTASSTPVSDGGTLVTHAATAKDSDWIGGFTTAQIGAHGLTLDVTRAAQASQAFVDAAAGGGTLTKTGAAELTLTGVSGNAQTVVAGGDWDVDTVKFPDLKRHVDEAHELGIYIAQTLPKKPKSPLQRYRLLRKGKDVLA